MYTSKLIYLVFLLFGICSQCFSFDEYQSDTGQILDLLGKKNSNKQLVNTVVNCMGKTYFSNGKSNDFIRCVNDLLHTDEFTNRDDVKYIMGNYAARSAMLMMKCYSQKKDILYCLRALGECLPALLRQLYGIPDYTRKCRRLVRLPKYDRNENYLKDEDADDEDFDTFDDEDDGYDEYDEDYDYDDYDYDLDEYDDDYDDDYYDEDAPDEFEDYRSERVLKPLSLSKKIKNFIISKTEIGSKKVDNKEKQNSRENKKNIDGKSDVMEQHQPLLQENNENVDMDNKDNQATNDQLSYEQRRENSDDSKSPIQYGSDTESLVESVEVIEDPGDICGEVVFDDEMVKNIKFK